MVLGLRHLVVHMAADDEEDRRADRSALPEHIQMRQILRIEAQLHTPTDQRRIHRIAIASQRHGGGGRDAPQHRPAEGFTQ